MAADVVGAVLGSVSLHATRPSVSATAAGKYRMSPPVVAERSGAGAGDHDVAREETGGSATTNSIGRHQQSSGTLFV